MKQLLGTIQTYLRKYWSLCLFTAVVFFTTGFNACNLGSIPKPNGNYDLRFFGKGIKSANGIEPVYVAATAVDSHGNLFIGGRFSQVSNRPAKNIAFFDTASGRWSELAGGGLVTSQFTDVSIEALTISGKYLYVGGSFDRTADTPPTATDLNGIARYDMELKVWSAFAGNGLYRGYGAEPGLVKALAISGDNLFVGGEFTRTYDPNTQGDLNGIARYNTATNTWSPLANKGLQNSSVAALAISDNALFVGGTFTQTVDPAIPNLNNIARYDIVADAWLPPFAGNGLNGPVTSFATTNTTIFYVGGNFTQAANGQGPILNHVALYSFQSNSWGRLTSAGVPNSVGGVNGPVSALALSGYNLYVGGQFNQSEPDGPTNLNNIARYNGSNSAWSSLPGDGLNGKVRTLTISGDGIFIGGDFEGIFSGGTSSLRGIARYTFPTGNRPSSGKTVSDDNLGAADEWQNLGFNGAALNRQINAIAVAPNGDIYAGGDFDKTADGLNTDINYIARYNPTTNTWSALSNSGLDGTVYALEIYGDNLYVGGSFVGTNDNTINLAYIARYNLTTNTWSQLTDRGVNGTVKALAVSGDNLYVGGAFSMTADGGTTNLNTIARYNMTTNTWSPLAGNGLNGFVVNALSFSGSDLYVGGFFTATFNGATTDLNHIALFNTANNTWSPLANNGLNFFVEVIGIYDGNLFVRGQFSNTFVPSTPLDRLARYNLGTSQWSAITGDQSGIAAALTSNAVKFVGTDLYVGGTFTNVGGGTARYLTSIYLQQWKVSASNSDWFDGANWVTENVPTNNSNAVIPEGAGQINITSADVVLRDLNVNGGTLTVGAGRTLTINGILNLNGGIINGDGSVVIANCKPEGIMFAGQTSYIQTTLVRCVNNLGAYSFDVGTANGYSPIMMKDITGAGNVSIKANQGAYSGAANGLSPNRLARWWNIENPGGGVTNANVFFNYNQSDINGDETNYRAYRISSGTATAMTGSVNIYSNRVSAENITAFSDWTLAELAPLAAQVSLGGRVTTTSGQGIGKVQVSMTKQNGETQTILTNAFGYYLFNELEAGETYIIAVRHKRFAFMPDSIIVNLKENVENVNFTASP